MNAANLHLVLNHLPVFGLAFAMIWFLVGIIMKSQALKQAALLTMVAVALGTLPAYFSGEGAEEILEDSYVHNHDAIHEHEEAAVFGLTLALLAGAGAAVAWWMNRQNKWAWTNYLTLGLMALALASMIRIGHLGGAIRHPEISGAPEAQGVLDQPEERDDD
jgi:uncharacterized membrane protein